MDIKPDIKSGLRFTSFVNAQEAKSSTRDDQGRAFSVQGLADSWVNPRSPPSNSPSICAPAAWQVCERCQVLKRQSPPAGPRRNKEGDDSIALPPGGMHSQNGEYPVPQASPRTSPRGSPNYVSWRRISLPPSQHWS